MTDVSSVLNALPQVSTLMLLFIFVLIVLQEAVNGFHDTANAIAMPIYTNSMKPTHAVIMAAALNFLGVVAGGTAVAFSLVFLLPTEMVAGINTVHEASLMMALVITAVTWNLATWWLGIPNSTTHTYIGALIGVAMAHAFLAGQAPADGVNWHKGESIIITLIVSPIFGALLAYVFFKLIRASLKDPALYKPRSNDALPPGIVRWPLIVGSAGVSFLHGTNDGQKSIGLMLMILMGLAPGLYAIDPGRDQASYQATTQAIQDVEAVMQRHADDPRVPTAKTFLEEAEYIKQLAEREHATQPLTDDEEIKLRAEILDMHKALAKFIKDANAHQLVSADEFRQLDEAYDRTTALIENVPFWLIVLSALALGGGTMIGYRKIVTTLGEKMGENPVSPAEGLSAQAAAMASIAGGDLGGLPVSTTHVLTAGVAGGVISGGGRVQWNTISAILITWFTTLPGTVIASFGLALVLHTAFV